MTQARSNKKSMTINDVLTFLRALFRVRSGKMCRRKRSTHRFRSAQKKACHQPKELAALLRKTDKKQSITIGLALRFALNFSAGTKDYLRDIRFEINANVLTLHVSKAAQPLFDEACARRFRAMAESAELMPKIAFT